MLKDVPSFSSFSVSDVDAAKTFYADKLGLKAEVDENQPFKMLKIELVSGAKIIVYPKPDHQPATFTVLNFSVEDIDKAVDELKVKGVTFEHYDEDEIKTDDKDIARGYEGEGPSMAWFKDPSGNILALMQLPK